MSSCHEWITNVGTPSCYGKMMKKEMEKDDMLEDTYGSKEIISLDKKMKEHWATTEDQRSRPHEDSI